MLKIKTSKETLNANAEKGLIAFKLLTMLIFK
jgi:hypothetical protein